MAKSTPAAAPAAEAPEPVAAAAAPAAPPIALDDACVLMSGGRRPASKTLLAAFNFEEEQAGRLFDTEAAYRGRLAAFAARPAV